MSLAAIKASGFNMEPTSPGSVPNGTIFLDSTNSDILSIKTIGGVVLPIGSSSPPVTAPYFQDYIHNVTSASISSPDAYNPGTFRLSAYRNGFRLINSNSIDAPAARYQEAGSTTITLGLTTVLSDTIMLINRGSNVLYSNIITGVTGTTITVPTYVMGDNSLMVFRNGLLMNAAALDHAVDQYTEASTTTITLALAAVSTDVFLVESITAPAFRTDTTGLSGTVLNVGGSYVDGSKKLLAFRNGILMANTLTSSILSAVERYQESSTTEITTETAAASLDVWTFIGQ